MENYRLSICAKVCKECPFRKDSVKGWLGDLTPEEMLEHIFHERVFSCHMTRGEDEENNFLQIVQGKQPICRGFIISATKSAKRFGKMTMGRALGALQDSIDITATEREEIMTAWEFKEHHTLKEAVK